METEKDKIVKHLILELEKILDSKVEVIYAQCHRWRYGTYINNIKQNYEWDPSKNIGCIGDWFNGSRVENAMASAYSFYKNVPL